MIVQERLKKNQRVIIIFSNMYAIQNKLVTLLIIQSILLLKCTVLKTYLKYKFYFLSCLSTLSGVL